MRRYDIEGYAAKIAAESVRAEPPSTADLSDEALAASFAHCGVVPPASTYPAIREAFARGVGGGAF